MRSTPGERASMELRVASGGRARGRGHRVLAARILFGVVLLASALALGTVHSAVLCVVVAALAVVTAIGWLGAEPFRARRPATIILLVGVGLTLFTAAQGVRLPASWLAAVAPANADVWARALTPLHEAGPSAVPLTLDPVATHVQVLRGIAYLLAFLVAVRIANRRQGVVFIECAIAVTGLALAVAALLHPAFGAERVFGIYKHGPGITPRHVAPLLNPNHLAAYLNIAFCLALAAAIAPRPEVPRIVSLTVAAALVAVQLWAASRGGVLAMGVGAVLVIAMGRGTFANRTALLTTLALLVLVGAGVGMSVLASSDDSWAELASSDVSKFRVFREAMRVAAAFPWLGAGRGAFQSVFPAFRSSPGYNDFTFPENLVAQWTSEWGVPVSLFAAAALAFALRPAVPLARSRAPIGAWAALAATFVHNLVDYSSEVPGIVIALAACAGLCVAGAGDAHKRARIDVWSARPKLVAALALVASVAAIAWVVPNLGRDDDYEREALRYRALDPSVSAADFHATVRDVLLRHPAEPYMPFAGAVRASRAGDESAMPWLERTFERAAVYGPAHLLLARWIAPRSASQARMEYRFAVEQDAELWHLAATEAVPLVRTFDDAMEVVPSGKGEPLVLEALAEGLDARRPEIRRRLDDEILARSPRATAPLSRKIADVIAELQAGDASPKCGGRRAACLDEGDAIAKRFIEIEPSRCEPFEVRARLLVAAGQSQRALDVLQQAADRVTDRDACLAALVRTAHEAHDDAREGLALERMERAGCATEAECLQQWFWLAAQQEARGERSRALALYNKILEREPDNDAALRDKARLAGDAGMHAEALDAYKRLLQRHPDDAALSRAAAAERDAIYARKP